MQTVGTSQEHRCQRVTPGWNKAGHPLLCGKSSATFLTCAFSSQHFSSYPASSRSDVPSLCPASITSRYDVWSLPDPRARASSSRSQVTVSTASAASCLTWERPSVDVRWRPPLAVAIVTHLVTRLPAGFSLATWMQTTGACQVGTTAAASGHCRRSCMRAVVRPCCCTSCCTDLTLTRQGTAVTPSRVTEPNTRSRRRASAANARATGPA
jgi:hypothetical protein